MSNSASQSPASPGTNAVSRLLRNSGGIAAARFATAVASLLCVPVVVAKLGMAGYGTWEALTALGALITLLQTPITGTLLWRMSTAHGLRLEGEPQRMMRIGIGASLLLCAVLGTLVFTLRQAIVGWLHVPPDQRQQAAAVVVVVGVVMALGVGNDAIGSLVNAYQRAGATVSVLAVGSIANYLISILGLVAGLGLWSMCIGQIAAYLCTAVGLYMLARRVCGPLRLWPTLPTRTDLVAFRRYFGLLMVGSVSAALRNQTDKLVLATMASPVWTGYYGVAARLAALVMEASNFFYTPLFAAAGSLHAQDDWHSIKRLHNAVTLSLALIVGSVAVLLLGLGDWFIFAWIGRPLSQAHQLLMLILAGNVAAVILTGPGTAICKGVGRLGIETTYVIFGGALNLILTILLVIAMGPTGTVVASSISWVVGSILFVLMLHRLTPLDASATWRGVRALAAMAVSVAVIRFFARFLPPPHTRAEAIMELAAGAAPALGLYLIMLIAANVVPAATLHRWLKRHRRSSAPLHQGSVEPV